MLDKAQQALAFYPDKISFVKQARFFTVGRELDRFHMVFVLADPFVVIHPIGACWLAFEYEPELYISFFVDRARPMASSESTEARQMSDFSCIGIVGPEDVPIWLRTIYDGQEAVVCVQLFGYGVMAWDFDGLCSTAPVVSPVVVLQGPFSNKFTEGIVGDIDGIPAIQFKLNGLRLCA